jgi:hypothetical protein
MELSDAGSGGVIIVVNLIQVPQSIWLTIRGRVRVSHHVHFWEQFLSSGRSSGATLASHC